MVKKIVLWAAMLAFLAVSVQGCAYMEDLQSIIREELSSGGEDTGKDRAAGGGTEAEEAGEDSGTEAQRLPEVSELYYAYHKLDRAQQKVYLEMLSALAEMKNDAVISADDKSDIDLIFACVMNDHPELFYVEGYQITEYTLGTKTVNMTFSGTYSMTAEEARQAKAQIEQRLGECFREVPLNEDEYSTVLFLYEWLINNTEYDKEAENNQNIRSVFLQGRSVCQGYAKAMQYMLQKADIQCLLVTGFTNGERHAWNLARVDGDYYYLDPTWGDASYSTGNADSAAGGFAPSINYDYFLVTTDEITRTHSIERAVELPLCLATDDNYFVREGLYFESYDAEKVSAVFNGAKAKSDGYTTVKCGSAESYDMMIGELIGSQKVFDFADRRGAGIAYSANDKLRIISFWNLSD